MELSLFLARAWGLFITVCCLGILTNRKRFLLVLKNLKDGELMLAGMFVLGIGVIQVAGYEEWSSVWTGIITLFGWAAVLKGIAIFFIPGYSDTFLKVLVKEHIYTAMLVVGLLLGLYLLYVGYILQ